MTVTKRKAKPITAHPLFPIVTALWFAAFLSLGSFAVAPRLLEGPVVALGIPEILPAAQPPLGFTVRALLALVMLGVGGLAGFFVGKALAGKAEAPVRARSFVRKDGPFTQDAPSAAETSSARRTTHRRPLNPLEDLGEPLSGPFSGETYAPVDPRALEGFDDTYELDAREVARLPWEMDDAEAAHAVFESDAQPGHQDFGQHQRARAPHAHAQIDDPLALDLLFADAEVLSRGEDPNDVEPAYGEPDSEVPASDALATSAFVAADQAETAWQDESPDAVSAEVAPIVGAPELTPPQDMPPSVPLIKTPLLQAPATSPMPLSRTPLEDLGLVQLTERLALAIGRRQATAPRAAVPHAFAMAEPAAPPEAYQPSPSQPFAEFDQPVLVEPVLALPAEASSSGGFTIVQPQPAAVIARFGASETAPVSSPLDDAPADPAPQYERVVQLRPSALRPFTAEPDAIDEDVQEFDRFLRVREPKPSAKTPALPFPVADFTAADAGHQALDDEDQHGESVDDEDGEDGGDEPVWVGTGAEADVAEERYPSLLDMSASSLRHKVQLSVSPDADDYADGIEDDREDGGFEPAVVFPGQAAQSASPFETTPRLFERPAGAFATSDLIIPVPGSPLAAPGRAAPSSPIDVLGDPAELHAMQQDFPSAPAVDAEEADRALRAALATLQRMTAQG